MPAPFLSVITDDCIAKGQDYNAGGARYNHTFIQFVGIGSLTDSLSALKQMVFDEQEMTLDQFVADPGRGLRRSGAVPPAAGESNAQVRQRR